MTTRSIITIPVSALLLFGLFGCDKDDRDDIRAGAKNLVEEPKLQGDFGSQCTGSDVLEVSQKMMLKFRGNQLEQTQEFYNDDKCANEPIGSITYEGEFEVDEAKDSEGNEIDTIDVTFDKVTLNPEKEELVTILNGVNFCGRSDYKAGETADITGASEDITCFVTKVPQTFYGTYQLDDGNLYFASGSILDMQKDAADRETEVKKDEDSVYKK